MPAQLLKQRLKQRHQRKAEAWPRMWLLRLRRAEQEALQQKQEQRLCPHLHAPPPT